MASGITELLYSYVYRLPGLRKIVLSVFSNQATLACCKPRAA